MTSGCNPPATPVADEYSWLSAAPLGWPAAWPLLVTPQQPHREPRWTPLLGLRAAGLVVLCRVPVAIAFWIIFLISAAPVLNFLTIAMSIITMIVIVAIAPGVVMGYGLSRGLVERAGFTGVILSILPMIGTVAAVWIGSLIALSIRPIGDWQIGFASLATAAWACLRSFKTVVLDG